MPCIVRRIYEQACIALHLVPHAFPASQGLKAEQWNGSIQLVLSKGEHVCAPLLLPAAGALQGGTSSLARCPKRNCGKPDVRLGPKVGSSRAAGRSLLPARMPAPAAAAAPMCLFVGHCLLGRCELCMVAVLAGML